jgi:hypothetical protein
VKITGGVTRRAVAEAWALGGERCSARRVDMRHVTCIGIIRGHVSQATSQLGAVDKREEGESDMLCLVLHNDLEEEEPSPLRDDPW